MTANQPLVVKAAEAARRLGICRRTLDRLVAAGRLKPIRIGGRERASVRFAVAELESFARGER